MGFGGIAVLTHIKIQNHGVIGVADCGGVPPCVFCIKQHVLVCNTGKPLVVQAGFLLKTVANMGKALGFSIVFESIGG